HAAELCPAGLFSDPGRDLLNRILRATEPLHHLDQRLAVLLDLGRDELHQLAECRSVALGLDLLGEIATQHRACQVVVQIHIDRIVSHMGALSGCGFRVDPNARAHDRVCRRAANGYAWCGLSTSGATPPAAAEAPSAREQ